MDCCVQHERRCESHNGVIKREKKQASKEAHLRDIRDKRVNGGVTVPSVAVVHIGVMVVLVNIIGIVHVDAYDRSPLK